MPDAPPETLFSSPVLRFTVADGTGLIRLDRPEARNAINADAAMGIERCIDLLDERDDIQIAVITGTPPVFCAGADLKQIAEGNGHLQVTERGGFAGFVRRVRRKPVIAAVDGAALAGGMEIVLACDMVVAGRSATFGIPEVKRGLAATGGGLFRVGRRISVNVAMELALTGDPISAVRASELGLVNALCADGEAVEAATQLARRVAANAPLAVQQARRLVAVSPYVTEAEGWRLSAQADEDLISTADQIEGVRAFIEKRPAVWTGR